MAPLWLFVRVVRTAPEPAHWLSRLTIQTLALLTASRDEIASTLGEPFDVGRMARLPEP